MMPTEPTPRVAGRCPASISGMCLQMSTGFSFAGCMDECEENMHEPYDPEAFKPDKPVRRARRVAR